MIDSYIINSHRESYFDVNEKDEYILVNGKPIRNYFPCVFPITIYPSSTAIMVFDAWEDIPDERLNKEAEDIIIATILPIVRVGASIGHKILFTNNDPTVNSYCSKIHTVLRPFVYNNCFYPGEFTAKKFYERLMERGINRIIYTGFHSNACMIMSDYGPVAMKKRGMDVYIVPQASSAIEVDAQDHSLTKGRVHKYTIFSLSLMGVRSVEYDNLIAGMRRIANDT